MAEAFDCDVLIVGLGPVGAALAALLVRRGVRVIALDRETDIYPLPRAVHFDHEIMRLLQRLGLADEMRDDVQAAPAYEFRAADGQLLARLQPAAETPSGWAGSYMFHQPGLERALGLGRRTAWLAPRELRSGRLRHHGHGQWPGGTRRHPRALPGRLRRRFEHRAPRTRRRVVRLRLRRGLAGG